MKSKVVPGDLSHTTPNPYITARSKLSISASMGIQQRTIGSDVAHLSLSVPNLAMTNDTTLSSRLDPAIIELGSLSVISILQ